MKLYVHSSMWVTTISSVVQPWFLREEHFFFHRDSMSDMIGGKIYYRPLHISRWISEVIFLIIPCLLHFTYPQSL